MDIKTAYEMVKNDDAQPLFTEADQWNSMAGALKLQALSLKHRIDSYESGLDSDSGRAYVEALKERHKRLDEAATVAATNSTAWRGVAQLVQDNKNAIVKSHQDWETEKNKPENKDKTDAELESIRWPYDVVATAAMDTAVTGVAVKAETMKPPDEYQPMPDISGASSTVDSAPGSTAPNGTNPGGSAPGGSSPDGRPSPRPDNGGHFSGGGTSPELQNPPPSPHLPGPAGPPPGVPAPPPGGTPPPPPVLPSGPLPPPGTKPPLPPGGTKPTLPPGAKPTLPPKPGPLPPGVKPPTGTPGLKPPNTGLPGGKPPATGPRPPQPTLKPVIGSRPGTTGMAPTGGPRPGPGGINRPVIGTRPGPAPGAPIPRPDTGKALIGKNGVVGNPQRTLPGVRTPKAHFGGPGTNRSVISGVRQAFKPGTGIPSPATGGRKRDEQDSSHRPEGGDYQWTVDRTVVPGVIGGGDWTDREHTPGTVAEMRAETHVVDESATVERLSQRQADEKRSTTSDEDFWKLPTGGRGVVVRPKPERYDANDW